ncbi:carbohydrate kinase family protein [Allosalinactinospora lopnorensis]|uniref:carbohydrate kinase family protein n=1 Tax=Allosalinactinospora lopnorensis TaxID=1352348 RepID=UPI000623EF77|nr:carbohydrate kinase [Allosalinactinospora lopnorensis]
MLTVIGEALIDLISAENGTYRPVPGGAPANTAVALARLGAPVSLLARIGDDRFGRDLRTYIGSRGVDLRHTVAAPEPTTLAIADIDDTGRAEYSFYVHGTANWQWTPEELPDPLGGDVTAVHAGSLAMALPPGMSVLEKWLAAQREHVTVSYDPNIRPALAGPRGAEVQRIERQGALADVIKVSDEDLDWLYPDRPSEESLRRWADLGPSLLLLTRGSEETVAVRAGDPPLLVRRRPLRTEVADTVGAGDAFGAGVLDALSQLGALGSAARPRLAALDEAAVAACLEHAHLVAARTCERPGADPGELTLPPVRV